MKFTVCTVVEYFVQH